MEGECRGLQGRRRCWLPQAGRSPQSNSHRVTRQVPSWVCAEGSGSSGSNRYVHPTLTAALVTAAKGRTPAQHPLTEG